MTAKNLQLALVLLCGATPGVTAQNKPGDLTWEQWRRILAGGPAILPTLDSPSPPYAGSPGPFNTPTRFDELTQQEKDDQTFFFSAMDGLRKLDGDRKPPLASPPAREALPQAEVGEVEPVRRFPPWLVLGGGGAAAVAVFAGLRPRAVKVRGVAALGVFGAASLLLPLRVAPTDAPESESENVVADEVSAPLLAELKAALTHPSHTRRRLAVFALRYAVEKVGAPAVPALASALDNDAAGVHSEAAHALYQLGPAAKAAVPGLVGDLRQQNPKRVSTAAYILSAMPNVPAARNAVPILKEHARHPEPGIRQNALFALAKLGTRDEVLPIMVDALDAEDIEVRRNALDGLIAHGPAGKDVTPKLIRLLIESAKKNEYTKDRFSIAVAACGPDAVPELVAVVRTYSHPESAVAAETLGRMGASAKAAVPALAEAVALAPKTGKAAAKALGSLGQVAREAVPQLTKELLREADWLSKDHAVATAIGRIGGPDASEAVPELVRRMNAPISNSDDSDRAAHAIRSLGALGSSSQPAVTALVDAFRNARATDGWRDMLLAEAFGAIGPEAHTAVPDLVAVLRGPARMELLLRSIRALGKIGPKAEPAVPALERVLVEHLADEVLSATADTLRQIGPAARTAVPALLKVRNATSGDWGRGSRSHIEDAILNLDPDAARLAGIR